MSRIDILLGKETSRLNVKDNEMDGKTNVNVRMDVRGHGGNTRPIFFAKDPDVVKHLVDLGADPNKKNENGDTPLHLCESVDVAEALLEHGARPHHGLDNVRCVIEFLFALHKNNTLPCLSVASRPVFRR